MRVKTMDYPGNRVVTAKKGLLVTGPTKVTGAVTASIAPTPVQLDENNLVEALFRIGGDVLAKQVRDLKEISLTCTIRISGGTYSISLLVLAQHGEKAEQLAISIASSMERKKVALQSQTEEPESRPKRTRAGNQQPPDPIDPLGQGYVPFSQPRRPTNLRSARVV